jgi:hypothetical protein
LKSVDINRKKIDLKGINKPQINRPVTFREHFHVQKSIFDQPIDAIRLQLADYDDSYRPCPVHHPNRNHPYIRTFSDRQSSLQRTHSSVHSISTIATDFVHQYIIVFIKIKFSFEFSDEYQLFIHIHHHLQLLNVNK